MAMSGISEIQQAILALSDDDYAALMRWVADLDWERWDAEIEADAKAGKLDFLIDEAREAKENNTLTDL